jgi:LysR family transcriptional regulator for metE and metH
MKEKLNPILRGLTLKQLRALAAVVRTGSVAGAAEALSVTPPAISQQLHLLQDLLRVPLADRAQGGMRPTEAGREVLAALARIEAALADCAAAIEALRGMRAGHVAVGVISTAKYFAPRALAAFMRAHPHVELKLLVGNRAETVGALRNFELDVAVMGRPPEDDLPVECAVIGTHPHVMIAPPDHPLANARGVTLRALAGNTFLLREAGSGTRDLMRGLLTAARLDPDMGMEMGSNETIKQAVMAGIGVALLSAHTVAAELQDRRLMALDVEGTPVLRQWFVVRCREKRLLPAGQALWDHLVAHGADYLPEVRFPGSAGEPTAGAGSAA